MKKLIIFIFTVILYHSVVNAQTTSSKDGSRHLFVYRTEANNLSSYKIFINNKQYKVGTRSLLDFKVNNGLLDISIGPTNVNNGVYPVKLDFTSNKSIYLKVSINAYGSNIIEVSELTFLLETSDYYLKKQNIEIQ